MTKTKTALYLSDNYSHTRLQVVLKFEMNELGTTLPVTYMLGLPVAKKRLDQFSWNLDSLDIFYKTLKFLELCLI